MRCDVCVTDLVCVATEVLADHCALRVSSRPRPPLRYLRRKPGRVLVAVFGPGAVGDIYTVTVDEQALLAGPDAATPAGSTVQEFPVDPKLPHLDAVMSPSGHPALADALESTARRMHDVPPERPLEGIAAEPVRYKPGDRCVLRY